MKKRQCSCIIGFDESGPVLEGIPCKQEGTHFRGIVDRVTGKGTYQTYVCANHATTRFNPAHWNFSLRIVNHPDDYPQED